MEYRTLGRTGARVSRLCLGTMMFGGRTDDATARIIIDKAQEQGVNFIDTANVYNGGHSESSVGRLIAGKRDHWFLATKFVNPDPDLRAPNNAGASRLALIQSVEACLKRMGTDYIDLLYLHREDPDTPVAETVRALGDLVRAGKLRYYGLSNHSAWKLAEFCLTADALGIDRPAASQPLYNLANRQPELEHLPAADYFGIGVVSYSPLARGVLTAKYDPSQPPPPGSRADARDKRLQQTEWRPESMALARQIKDHAESRGLSAGQFALAWVLNNRLITSAIAGPRTAEQWDDYLPALAYRFTADDEALVDRLVAAGHPSTPGYNDPQYPLQGRKPVHL